jgi:hypothetical protein
LAQHEELHLRYAYDDKKRLPTARMTMASSQAPKK